MEMVTKLVIIFSSIAFLAVCIIASIIYIRFAKRQRKSLEYLQFEVKVPRYNEIKIEAAESFFTALYSIFRYGVHGLVVGQDHIGFEILSSGGSIKFYISVPSQLASLVEKQIHSFYPEAEITPVPEYNFLRADMYVDVAELSLRAPPYKPILRYPQIKEI